MTAVRARARAWCPEFGLALLLALTLSGVCHAEWFTLVGAPEDDGNYVQVDPTALRIEGDTRLMPVRVSRTHTRVNSDGVAYRSVDTLARIDCASLSASYVEATYYAEPHFAGAVVKHRVFGADEVRPMNLPGLEGGFAGRIVKAACRVTGAPRVSKPQNK